MVSFWPWKGDDSSPASFEKTLSALSAKISTTGTKLESLRQRSRRLNLLWTLYAGFAYLLYTIILVLVVGWRNWGIPEYAAVIGGPAIIYLVRFSLSSYYDYRTSNVQSHMDKLQKQRDSTIEKLKTATKYNSTQELLKKYSGTPTPKAKPAGTSDRNATPKQEGTPQASKVPFVPPPTANVPRRAGLVPLNNPQSSHSWGQQTSAFPAGAQHSPSLPVSPYDTSAEFAPSAFPTTPQYAQTNGSSNWYDRIMDVLLGDDETRPGARLALICSRCRLVNGQAPPGVKRLEDLGKWRCGGCGAMNKEESEVNKIVSSIKDTSHDNALEEVEPHQKDSPQSNNEERKTLTDEDHEIDITHYSSEDSEEVEGGKNVSEGKKDHTLPIAESNTPKRRSTRQTKGKKAR